MNMKTTNLLKYTVACTTTQKIVYLGINLIKYVQDIRWTLNKANERIFL